MLDRLLLLVISMVCFVVGVFLTLRTKSAVSLWVRYHWWGWHTSGKDPGKYLDEKGITWFATGLHEPERLKPQMIMFRTIGVLSLLMATAGLFILLAGGPN
jgi:hypothetical protein